MSGRLHPWQQAAWQHIQQARALGRLPHALLLQGEEGCGNELFANTLAQALLCLTPDAQGFACGHCRSCEVYQAKAHPDIITLRVLEGKQVIQVEQVRELGRFLNLSLSYSRRRVALIEAAGRMNPNAANALLKSLEEPVNQSHLLLLHQGSGALLKTIQSRCQRINLPRPSQQQALAWLVDQGLESGFATDLLSQALGRPVYALQLNGSDQESQQVRFHELLTQLLHQQLGITQFSAQCEKFELAHLMRWQLSLLKQGIWAHYMGEAARDNVLKTYSVKHLWQVHDALLKLSGLLSHPLNKRIVLEDMACIWLNKT